MIVIATLICFLCLRQLYVVCKNNSGKMKCKGIIGRFLDHRFVEYYGDRVCRICGLVQKEEAAGILMCEGDTWYDKGYAENKDELVNYYLERTRRNEERDRKWNQDHREKIVSTKISTPIITNKTEEKK